MKLHLPKTLLTAMLAGTMAQADVITPYQADNITDGSIDAPVDISADFVADQKAIDTPSDVTLSAYAKDGSGVAKIKSEEDVTLKTRLLVREGTLLIEDTNISVSRTSTGGARNGGGALMVGGKDGSAHLSMSGSNWVGKSGYNDSINIGNSNGSGSLSLTNRSSIAVSQALFMGHMYNSALADHMYESYVSPGSTEIYNKFDATNYSPGHGELNISAGSAVNTGTAVYLGDATINLQGDGAQLNVGLRAITSTSSMGRTCDATTDINISDGASFITYTATKVGRGSGSSTTIDVIGAGSLFKAENVFQMGDGRDDGVNAEGSKEISTSSLTVGDSGTAHIAELQMKGTTDSHQSEVIIQDGGTYTGYSINMEAGASITNNGTIKLVDGEYVSSWRDDNGWYGNTTNAAEIMEVNAELSLEEATIVNSGHISVDGALSMSNNATLNLVITDFANLPSLTVESLTLTDGATLGLIFDNLTLANEAMASLFGVQTLSEESVAVDFTDLIKITGAGALQDAIDAGTSLSLYYYDDKGEVLEYTDGTENQVTVGIAQVASIPEPSTATLSLLALAALAARRRRR